MLVQAVKVLYLGAIVLGIFLVDYALGNDIISGIQIAFIKTLFLLKNVFWKETPAENGFVYNISVPVYVTEIFVFVLTIWILKKCKPHRSMVHLDKLLRDSKETLRQTNEFLEKWRLRRLNLRVNRDYESSYLSQEPHRLRPMKIEIPVLHMAIIDTSRSQHERGDAGDTCLTDSTILSVTSLFDDDVTDNLDLDIAADIYEEKSKNVRHFDARMYNTFEEEAFADYAKTTL